MKQADDKEAFQLARLQSWFRDGKERYWVLDESQQVARERQARRAATHNASEESDALEPHEGSRSDGDDSHDEVDNQIVQEIENWKAEAQERRLRTLKNVPAVEMDSWLQYTKWNKALGRSKHNLVKTAEFARSPRSKRGILNA